MPEAVSACCVAGGQWEHTLYKSRTICFSRKLASFERCQWLSLENVLFFSSFVELESLLCSPSSLIVSFWNLLPQAQSSAETDGTACCLCLVLWRGVSRIVGHFLFWVLLVSGSIWGLQLPWALLDYFSIAQLFPVCKFPLDMMKSS